MKGFQDFLEDSAAPGTTTVDVGKPEGGMVKEPVKKPKDLEEEQEKTDFQKIFGEHLQRPGSEECTKVELQDRQI